jgi:hypothetical protein
LTVTDEHRGYAEDGCLEHSARRVADDNIDVGHRAQVATLTEGFDVVDSIRVCGNERCGVCANVAAPDV